MGIIQNINISVGLETLAKGMIDKSLSVWNFGGKCIAVVGLCAGVAYVAYRYNASTAELNKKTSEPVKA